MLSLTFYNLFPQLQIYLGACNKISCDFVWLIDIYPERKGNAGESVFGKTFEGKIKLLNLRRNQQKRVRMCFLALDESFAVLHNKRGILGMANKGPHTNGSQFYITLQPTPWMDRTFVAFGFVSLQLLKLSGLHLTRFIKFVLNQSLFLILIPDNWLKA